MIDHDDVWAVARRVCTPAELEALRLHEQVGYSRIAAILGITKDTARDRVRRAEAKIRRQRASLRAAARGAA